MAPENVLPKMRELFYGGQWHAPALQKYFYSVNPATQESLGKVANANKQDLDAAVTAAQQAFKIWKDVAPLERANYLRRAARKLLEHKEEIAMLDAIDGGNPFQFMQKDIDYMAASLEFYAGLVTELKGETIPMGAGNFNYTVHEPLGVIGQILAFNHPALFIGWTIGAPLAAGNTVIVKPAEQTPLSALYIAELFATIFPAGVFNLLTGDRELGSLMTSHPLIRKIMFIGSVNTGRAVMEAAAKTLKQVTLEMGGKNAMVIYPDADPEKAAASAIAGMNLAWSGQSCGSTSRIFIHESSYDTVLAHIVKRAKLITPGLPSLADTQMGCLTSREHYEKVKNYIQIGIAEGAKLIYGGKSPSIPQLAKGNFLLPTIFSDVKPLMRIAQEEIFGPVMSVLKWNNEEEMIANVNNVNYGLTAAIWTKDLETAHKIAGRIEAGYVWINQAGTHFLGAPFGGQKQSGIGRLGCLQTMLDCTQLKNVNIAFAKG